MTTVVRNISHENTGSAAGYLRVLLHDTETRPHRTVKRDTLLTFVPRFDEETRELLVGAEGVIAATDLTGLLLDDPVAMNGQELLKSHLNLIAVAYLHYLIDKHEHLAHRWGRQLDRETLAPTRESLEGQIQAVRETNQRLQSLIGKLTEHDPEQQKQREVSAAIALITDGCARARQAEADYGHRIQMIR